MSFATGFCVIIFAGELLFSGRSFTKASPIKSTRTQKTSRRSRKPRPTWETSSWRRRRISSCPNTCEWTPWKRSTRSLPCRDWYVSLSIVQHCDQSQFFGSGLRANCGWLLLSACLQWNRACQTWPRAISLKYYVLNWRSWKLCFRFELLLPQ